jgi:hypothetical protein
MRPWILGSLVAILVVAVGSGCAGWQTGAASQSGGGSAKEAPPGGINHSVTRSISVGASVDPGESKVIYALRGRRDRLYDMRRNPYGRLVASCSSTGIPATRWIVPALAPNEEVTVEGRGRSAGGQVLPGGHIDGGSDRGGLEVWSVDAGRQSEEYHLNARLTASAVGSSQRSCQFRLRGKLTGIVR